MALTIVNEQHPPRKPKLTLTADSLDELPTEGVAEGSTATVGGTEYSYDSNAGWIVPGSGGGGSGGGVFVVTFTGNDLTDITADKTLQEILQASTSQIVMGRHIRHNFTSSALGIIYTYPDMGSIADFIFWNLDGEAGDALLLRLDEGGTVTVGEWSWAIQEE